MSIISELKKNIRLRRLSKSRAYYRFRQHFPQPQPNFGEDPAFTEWKDAQTLVMDWPADIRKPLIGLVRDNDHYPRWTKYVRFFEKNAIPYEMYDIHRSDWLEKARKFDAIIGLYTNDPSYLDEARRKHFFIERNLGLPCYPNTFHLYMYEDKRFEAYFCELLGLPFARTFITYDKNEALEYIKTMPYPAVSKIDPSSGSVTVELIRSPRAARRIINEAFSVHGRKTHMLYMRQKDYVYFQQFIPNDGFDLRILIAGDCAYGFRRKAPVGDFRASGMDLIFYGDIPPEPVIIARKLYNALKSPMLGVDFVHGLDGKYYIIEYSPFTQIRKPSGQLKDDERGVFVFDTDETFHYQKQMIWIHDLALAEFFRQEYLSVQAAGLDY